MMIKFSIKVVGKKLPLNSDVFDMDEGQYSKHQIIGKHEWRCMSGCMRVIVMLWSPVILIVAISMLTRLQLSIGEETLL